MAKTFEELSVWQESRALVRDVYRISESGDFRRDLALRVQIRRAVISIPSNIAEGFERGGGREFRQFVTVAKGSCGEVRTQLYILRDIGHVESDAADPLIERIGRMLGALRRALIPAGRRA
ncbi:MAG TPA: four helix bundle protein [Gemmatimonadales bacterium]|nr:four helix bundle protein [Gemmatimonadales bacterium]